MAQNNSVRMFGGQNPQTEAGTSFGVSNAWVTSYVNAGSESNVAINVSQLPLPGLVSNLVQANGQSYLPGYQPISVGSYSFSLIPFKYGGQPRLISPNAFLGSMKAPQADLPPIPNAWSVEGEVAAANQNGATSLSYVSTNPEKVYPFKMQGYIRFTLNPNSYSMIGEGIPCGSGEYGYGPAPVEISSSKFYVPECCMGQIQATLNVENEPGDLYSVLFQNSIYSGQAQVLPVLLQRVNEFCPNCSTANVIGALASCMTSSSTSSQHYYLYCTRTGDPSSLTCTAFPSTPEPFMSFDYPADSRQTVIAAQQFGFDFPNFAFTNFSSTFPSCITSPPLPASVICTSSNLMWAPGTGYNGFLGELSLCRKWLVVGGGFCALPP